MQPTIGKSARQYIEERRKRDSEFDQALVESRREGDLAIELVRIRELRGMSQYDLAEITGMKQPMIARIERGGQNPTLPTLRKLATALKATIQISAAGVTVRAEPPEMAILPERAHQNVV